MKTLNPEDCTALVERLSPRQRDVLKLLAEGLARKQVAAQLGIEIGTVNANCEAVYARLGVSSVAAAVSIATRAGL